MKHALLSLSLASGALLSGCDSHHDSHEKPNYIGGGGDGPFFEVEVNDDAWNANWFGEIVPGDFIPIEGSITECCPDPYDGFAFYAYGPVRLRITLFEFQPGADLDFAIFLPEVNGVVAAYETDNHPEVGVFDFVGPGELHVVVRSFSGNSSYRLEVDVRPLPFAMTAGPGTPDASPSPFSLEAFSGYAAPEPERARVLTPVPALPEHPDDPGEESEVAAPAPGAALLEDD